MLPSSYLSTDGAGLKAGSPKPHLLIVEDHESTRVFLKHVLRVWYRTDFAANASEGLRLAATHDYDGFLVDIGLQGGQEDGIDVLEGLRTDERYAEVPVVAVTAHVLPGDREHLLSSGFDAYLGKPFFRNDLLTVLDQFFGHRPADA